MIYTITLNPALDHYMEVNEFRVDDANRVTMESLYAGGKGIDVSRAVRHLGATSIALGFIGGHNGRVMVDLLKREGVDCYFTPIAQETRRNILITNRSSDTHTMLNARGPSVTGEEWQSFLTHLRMLELRDSHVVLGGSLPRGVPPDAYYQIIKLVQREGAKAVLDADGPPLKAGLKARPFAIKPNLNELRRLTGNPLSAEPEILAAAQAIHRRGVQVVMVSRGRLGLIVVGRSTRRRASVALRAVPPRVVVRSTVGAGYSAVAGFVFRHAGGKTLEECVDRKSTRLNSSHQLISYAVFCLKKKKNQKCTEAISHKRRRRERGC